MAFDFPAQNHSTRSILSVLALGLSAIYFVPFLVPVHDGLSDSYLFGYSNRTAIVLLAVFAVSFAIWTRGLGLRLPDPLRQAGDRFGTTAGIAITCSLIGCILFWLLAWALGPLMEAQYFLDRYAMFSIGGHLYKDFGFDYGPLLFYPAVWLARLCRVSIGNGYFLSWTLQWVLGTWVLWKVVEVAARGTRHGRAIFLMLWLFFVTGMPDSGPNYTPLRFCGTLAIALCVHSLYFRGAGNVAAFGVAFVGATSMLLYSPEQGIALTAGTILFFGLCVRRVQAGVLRGLAGFILSMAIMFWLAFRYGVLGNVGNVGGGALNFPLLLSFQSIVLLLLLLVAGCVFVTSVRHKESRSVLPYLICISLASAPAAFSRADIGHIIINTLGALIVALIVLSQYPTVWRWTWSSFALVIVLSTFGKFTWYKGTLQIQIHDAVFGTQYRSPQLARVYTAVYKLTHRNAEVRLERLRTSLGDIDSSGPHLPPGTHLIAPLGVERRLAPPPDGIVIVTGWYPWLFPMTSTAPIKAKIAEIQAHPDWPLLLPSPRPQVCVWDPEEERRSMRKLMLAPFVPRPRGVLDAGKPMCDFLNANFVLSSYTSPAPRSYVWVRKQPATGLQK
jgi:hypothetical protein